MPRRPAAVIHQSLTASLSGFFLSRCVIRRYSETVDAFGNPAPTYTNEASETRCGFRPARPGLNRGAREVQQSGAVAVIDAAIRLPRNVALSSRDRVLMTCIEGRSLDVPEEYEVVGPVMRDPSGAYHNLRSITGRYGN